MSPLKLGIAVNGERNLCCLYGDGGGIQGENSQRGLQGNVSGTDVLVRIRHCTQLPPSSPPLLSSHSHTLFPSPHLLLLSTYSQGSLRFSFPFFLSSPFLPRSCRSLQLSLSTSLPLSICHLLAVVSSPFAACFFVCFVLFGGAVLFSLLRLNVGFFCIPVQMYFVFLGGRGGQDRISTVQ